MMGHYKNTSNRLLAICAGSFLSILPALALAQDISDSQITASTTMAPWGSFTIEQIADGKSADVSPHNGFTTNSKTGAITLTLDQAYDLDGFKIWNDVNVRAEGIKAFQLNFRNADGGILSSQIFETTPGLTEMQSFSFPVISNVNRVELVVLSSHKEPTTFAERIEVREVAFTGEPARDLKAEINDLEITNGEQTAHINQLVNLLAEKEAEIAALKATPTASNTEIKKLKGEIATLKADILKLQKSLTLWKIAAGLFVLLSISLGTMQYLQLLTRRQKTFKTTPSNVEDLNHLQKGMVFAASPMSSSGLPPSLALVTPIYNAVGRIGFAQKGKPTGREEAFGTGILISERHVLTNRHVWEMFKERLAGNADAGIEFHAEKNKAKTDFVAFDGAEPVCIDGMDAAIFTLSRIPEARKPVAFIPRPMEELDDLDVVVVGYPQAHNLTPEIAAVTEKSPIFGVKRYSEGKIFRHSTDTDTPYGVEAVVSDIINPAGKLRAVCHNASTLGGSSGSAVICKKTGDLVALHFGFDTAFDWKEATNFAIAGDMLAGEVAKIIGNI